MSDHTVSGELVVDARKPLEFEVSDHDVKSGKALKSRECPGNNGVCRALKAVHPTLANNEVRVHLSRTYIHVPVEVARKDFGADVPRTTEGHVWLRFANTAELSNQVYRMDRKQDFTPGKYRLGAPPQTKPRKPGQKPRKYVRHTSKRRALKGIRKWGINR